MKNGENKAFLKILLIFFALCLIPIGQLAYASEPLGEELKAKEGREGQENFQVFNKSHSKDPALAQIHMTKEETGIFYSLNYYKKLPLQGGGEEVLYKKVANRDSMNIDKALLEVVYNGYNGSKSIESFKKAFAVKGLDISREECQEATQRALFYYSDRIEFKPEADRLNSPLYYMYEFLLGKSKDNAQNPLGNLTFKKLDSSQDFDLYIGSDPSYASLIGTRLIGLNTDGKVAILVKKLDQGGKPLTDYSWQIENRESKEKLLLSQSQEKEGKSVFLAPGKYRLLEEAKGKEDLPRNLDFDITNQGSLFIGGKEILTKTILLKEDNVKDFSLQVLRIDKETKEPVLGGKLQVLKEGQLQEMWLSEKEAKGLKLPPGTYILRETHSPKAYALAKEIPFTLTEDAHLLVDEKPVENKTLFMASEKLKDSPLPDSPKKSSTRVRLIKQDIHSKKALQGAEFSLYKNTGKISKENKTLGAYLAPNSSLDSLKVTLLKEGKDQKTLNLNKSQERIDLGSEAEGDYSLKIEPIESKAIKVEIEKGNFVVHVWNLTDSKEKPWVDNTSRLCISRREPGQLVGSYTTNGQGSIVLDKLDEGDYYLVEIKAPNGYKADVDKRFNFTLGESSPPELTIIADNRKIDGRAGSSTKARGSGGRSTSTNSRSKNPQTFVEGYGPHIMAMGFFAAMAIYADRKRRERA